MVSAGLLAWALLPLLQTSDSSHVSPGDPGHVPACHTRQEGDLHLLRVDCDVARPHNTLHDSCGLEAGRGWRSLRLVTCTAQLPGVVRQLELDQLRRLNLSHNQLSELTADTFARLPQLRLLDLSHNQLATIDKVERCKCVNISYLL